MRRLLVLVMLAAAIALGRAPTLAGACTCSERSIAQRIASADVVLVGEVVDQEPSGEDDIHDAVRNTIEVERVYAGTAGPEVAVLGGESSSGACEYGFRPGRHLVFAREEGGALRTDLCAGTRLLGVDEPVPAGLGAGEAPTASGAPSTGAPHRDGEDPSWDERLLPGGVVAGGVLVVLALALTAIGRSRRRQA